MKKKKNEKRIRKGEKPLHIELQQAYIIVMTGWISGFSHVELLAQWLSALQTFFSFCFFDCCICMGDWMIRECLCLFNLWFINWRLMAMAYQCSFDWRQNVVIGYFEAMSSLTSTHPEGHAKLCIRKELRYLW